ncbi:MAG: PDDEXK nuclease domain-containing protein [Spirochaetaceae bacterium]
MNEIADNNIYKRILSIIDESRSNVVRTVNHEMVKAYWFIGKEIVEEQQNGKERAEYGDKLIELLSKKLTNNLGKGFSATNLKYFRLFYKTYSNDKRIRHPLGDEFKPNLSWSHYRNLIKVDNDNARSFYEVETSKNRWNKRELERQISTGLFERVSKGKSKEQIIKLSTEGNIIQNPIDIIKDPLILEFLNLPESNRLVESKLEEALVSNLQAFLLELGSGFAFLGRQKRITLDNDHFYVDLVFYHTKLKCYVIVDIKTEKLSHGDLGQIQLYVNYYDREIKEEEDNPTLGLVLCTDKNDEMVRYLLGDNNNNIFTSKYKVYLPDQKQLEEELKREVTLLTGNPTTGNENE